jgi:phosphosulfolactate phosphohydrolase-like enzyme
MFSLEDAVCAGALLAKLGEKNSLELLLSDAAQASAALYKSFGKSILKMIRGTEHGIYLTEIGFADDLSLCAGVDTIPVLPQLSGSVVKIKQEVEKNQDVKVSVS